MKLHIWTEVLLLAALTLNISYQQFFCQKSQIVACHIRVFYVICLYFILMCAVYGSNEFLCYS